MTKADRQIVFNKYGGKCAYCGTDLVKGWHVDHINPIQRFIKKKGCENPQNENIDNYNPSCASCNINKHSMSLEDFRNLIKGFMKHLNEINTQYKIAKRYGLVSENDIEIKFYFEKTNQCKH